MREFKFRAWDKEKKKYIDEELFIDLNGDLYYLQDLPRVKLDYHDAKKDVLLLTLEQYTELKDKNSKEIYESDIIKDKIGRIMQVVFCKDHFRWEFKGLRNCPDWKDAEMFQWFEFGKTDVEVIGNIHENKELLEEKK